MKTARIVILIIAFILVLYVVSAIAFTDVTYGPYASWRRYITRADLSIAWYLSVHVSLIGILILLFNEKYDILKTWAKNTIGNITIGLSLLILWPTLVGYEDITQSLIYYWRINYFDLYTVPANGFLLDAIFNSMVSRWLSIVVVIAMGVVLWKGRVAKDDRIYGSSS